MGGMAVLAGMLKVEAKARQRERMEVERVEVTKGGARPRQRLPLVKVFTLASSESTTQRKRAERLLYVYRALSSNWAPGRRIRNEPN